MPSGNKWGYLRITHPYLAEIQPDDHSTRSNFLFQRHPTRVFIAVETADGTFLDSDWDQDTLVRKRFYEYPNGGRFNISDPYQDLTPSETALLASKRKLDSATLIGGLVIEKDEMEAVYVVGDNDWNPFFRTHRWERTLHFVYDFADHRVSALKPFLWEKPDSWIARAYLQGHDDIAVDKVKVWGRIEYGKITRGHLWVIVRTYKRPKGQAVAAAPQIAGVEESGDVVPMETALLGNYPNPFNPETWIPYHLAHAADVQITIYDTEGAVVRELDLGWGITRIGQRRRIAKVGTIVESRWQVESISTGCRRGIIPPPDGW